jgi:tetratricopeptide (TPR) repeat protein
VSVRIVAAVCGLLWLPLVLAQPVGGVSRYRPNDAVLQSMTEAAALDLLRELLQGKRGLGIGQPGAPLAAGTAIIVGVDVLEDRIQVTVDRGPSRVREFSYGKLSDIEAGWKDQEFFTNAICYVALGENLAITVADMRCAQTSSASLRKLADALHVLMRAAQGVSPEKDRQFAEIAARYRAMAEKPPFPEEARRFRVQAEAAVQGKRLGDAERLYGEALKVVPWWVEGYFNRALLLGELGNPHGAIASMKRYLLLAPDAPQARAAQDKIYVWEADASGQNR